MNLQPKLRNFGCDRCIPGRSWLKAVQQLKKMINSAGLAFSLENRENNAEIMSFKQSVQVDPV